MFGRLFLSVSLFFLTGAPLLAQTIRHVPAGGDLQAAITLAQPGDTITLVPGAIYTGNFVLPAKAGNAYITIRSAAPDSLLPAADERVTPAVSALLPKLRSPNVMSVLRTSAGAHHYRLMHLELFADVAGTATILALGDGSSQQKSLASVPYAIEVDRVYIRGHASLGAKRGIGLNSASTTIINSYISEIKAVGQDSQAIGGWNGPGPYFISNNYLEAAGENVMFGGADPAIANLIPSDITFTRNHLSKPLSWRGSDWTVKNLFELKSAQRVRIDGNLFEHNWAAAQTGSAILLKSVNQDGGAPWSVVQDVQFTNNVVRNVSSAINILGRDPHFPAIEANNTTVRNNLFSNVSGSAFGGTGRLLLINGGSQITFNHNTVINDGASTVFADGDPVQGFVFTNNVMLDNGMSIKASGVAEGTATLAGYFPGAIFTGNIVAKGNASAYPAGNFYPTLQNVGFMNYASGDYRLADTSAFRHAATDGTAPGVDHAVLFSPTEVASPTPSAPSAPGPSAPSAPAPSAPSAPSASSAPSNAERSHLPHALASSVSGSDVRLSWSAPRSAVVLHYIVEAGSAPGAANIARLVTGNSATSLVAQAVPVGRYYVRVRAMTSAGLTEPSSDMVFNVGAINDCAAPPSPAVNLEGRVNGSTVQLQWASGGTCAPTHFIVQAGSQRGLSNLAQITTGSAALVASAPPGTYYVRVIAANSAGLSAASHEIVVTVTP
jgi:hypothetical protein